MIQQKSSSCNSFVIIPEADGSAKCTIPGLMAQASEPKNVIFKGFSRLRQVAQQYAADPPQTVNRSVNSSENVHNRLELSQKHTQ